MSNQIKITVTPTTYRLHTEAPTALWLEKMKQYPMRKWEATTREWVIPRHLRSEIELSDDMLSLHQFDGWTLEFIRQNGGVGDIEENMIKKRFPFLFPFQVSAVRRMVNARYFLNTFACGLGKSMTALSAAVLAVENEDADAIVIVAPNSVLGQWKNEAMKWFEIPEDRIVMVTGTKKQREELWQQEADIHIVSYDVLRQDHTLACSFVGRDRLVVIYDEVTRCKNDKAQITKVAREFSAPAAYRFALTGTPVSKSLYDYFHILQLVDPLFMSRSFFEARYPIWDILYLRDRTVRQLVGYKNLDDFVRRIQTHTVRETKASVGIQLPPMTIEYRRVEMTPAQAKLEEDIIAYAKANGKTIFNVWSLLHSLADGVDILMMSESDMLMDYIAENGAPASLDCSRKLEELKEFLEDCDGEKVVIFSQYIRFATAAQKFLGNDAVLVTGETPNRDEIVKKFKTDPAVKYLCCTDALAFGVDFPEIDFLVSLDLNPDLATMLQRPERIYRITSTRPKTVVAFYSSGIEEDIYEILKGKAALVEQITEGKAADKSVNIKAEIGRKYGLVSRREEN